MQYVSTSRLALPSAIVVALSTVASGQIRVPQTLTQEAQKRVEDAAQLSAQRMADFAKGWQVGMLHPDVSRGFTRWEAAVQLWRKEKDAGAAPLLAEGVLFDCLSRLRGVKTPVFRSEGGARADVTEARRPARAARAFEAALKINPRLVEARMRAARIRAPEDSRAVRELETIANDALGTPFSYLAAMSRAAVAHARSDSMTALHWYERALALNPRSTAAAIAVSVLKPAQPLLFEGLDTADLYYEYPCRVLTADVATALSERVRKVVLKR